MNIISFSILFGCLLFNTSSVLSDNQIEENNQNTFLISWRTTQLITLCMQTMMNLTDFEIELQTSKVEGNLTEFFTSQCLMKDPLLRCVGQKYPRFFGQSLTNIEIRERDFNLDLIRDIITYHCSNQGLIILTSYFNNIEFNCVEDHISLFQSCFQMTLKNDSFIENNTNEVNCAGIKLVQNCVSFNLQHSSNCNGIEISTYLNGLLNKIFDDNICRNRSILPLCDIKRNGSEEMILSFRYKIVSFKIYGGCIEKTLNFTTLEEHKNNQNLTQFFKSFCSQQDIILRCYVEKFTGGMRLLRNLPSTLQNVINQMDYLCHDEGLSLAAIVNDTDVTCLTRILTTEYGECVMTPNYNVLHSLASLCSYHRTKFDCFINEFSSCEIRTGATILIERFFNKYYDEHLCKNIPKCRLDTRQVRKFEWNPQRNPPQTIIRLPKLR